MKFRFRLMQEAGELMGDAGGAEQFVVEEGDEEGWEQPSTQDHIKELGLDPSKYGLDKEDELEASEDAPQDEDSQANAAPVGEESALLERINALGAIHSGSPIKVENVESLKNLIQQGHDYTVKTQSLSEERKVFEQERGVVEKELQGAIDEFNEGQKVYGEKLKELDQWVFTIEQLKVENPEVFEAVSQAYSQTSKQFSNPYVDQKIAALEAKISEVNKGLTSREDELILKGFDTDWAALSSTEQSLNELGVKVDKEAVKKQWAETGLPLKQVVGMMYFEQLAKTQASKAKVATVAKKVAAKPSGVAASARPGEMRKPIEKSGDYLAMANQLLKRYST